EEHAEAWPFPYDEALQTQLLPYLDAPEQTPEFTKWLESIPPSADRTIDFLVEINQRLQDRVRYTVRMEPGVQSPEETLVLGSGSCRDSAWLLTQSLRHVGLAARFVSGYLIQLTSDVAALDGPSGPPEDFCDLHAWTEVYLPGAGWVGMDPTSGLFAGEGHIPLACTPDFTDAAPITGATDVCEVEFDFQMSVQRVHEDPRVTKPYSDEQWRRIMQTGDHLDDLMKQEDVRLTMGGEPTFVSIDDMDSPQWTSDAVGPEKRVLSNVLLRRMQSKVAAGSLLHYGQGKWYPGESLPRWALTCLWRKDGQPIWRDSQWMADEGVDYGFTHDDAKKFVYTLARKLNISARATFPVFEDTFHYLWKENRLPHDTDPTDPKLDDPNERAMMIRTFTRGLSQPVGYTLPLRRAWWQAQPGWIGGRWPVRGENVFLIPGDSPIGLRLPLESLPVASHASNQFHASPFDPTANRGSLPQSELHPNRGQGTKGNALDSLRDGTTGSSDGGTGPEIRRINEQVLDAVEEDDDLPTSDDIIHTALCVECRHGRLHVFMPPVSHLEDYLDLLDAVQAVCESLQLPVIIEGYLPPTDSRVDLFKITPDPGVIEVNTQPSGTWRELTELTETLYEEARLTRLGTEKFDLDGLHTGTGGGNHIVLGGSQPADSPFLRRPDLLASMVAFWNNHPSLSYLFSGRFVGPTSQAPRADEGRMDGIHQLELALSQVPARSESAPPWTTDRLFRDLLTDLTGNTHRAEICIDKMYSPDSSTGRLGLVELRGFEMPPHARMSLAQQLLIRGLVLAFWQSPYREPLSRWGTSLHDRFMLPHCVWTDFQDVIAFLDRRGLGIEHEWFGPHFEFRFPRIGSATYDDVTLTLRNAIEPWYVMGEEPGASGTTRFVDSSVERVELRAENFDVSRHAILCNGRTVPMHATGIQGTFIAGVRFRAWQPPRCLHPTIGIDAPLRFELVDRETGYSRGGCTYHVVHPGGRGTDRFPINSVEAESRRAARFDVESMTGGVIDLPPFYPPAGNQAFPITFDLLRANAGLS
ncbi:MAG: transglutaminase family protein, partial [Planctomycetota bacterium]